MSRVSPKSEPEGKGGGIQGRRHGLVRTPTARHSSTAFPLHDCMLVTEQFYLREFGVVEVLPGVFAVSESQDNGSPA